MSSGIFDHRRAGLVLTIVGALSGRCIIGDESSAAVADSANAAASPSANLGATEEDAASGDAPLVAAAPAPGIEHPLAPAIRIAQGSLTRLQSVEDYETTLVKSERTSGRLVEQTMHMKYREQPLSIYLKYGEPFIGREVLFVHGQNDNRVLAHEGSGATSPVGTAALEPQDLQVTRDSRYPITEFGMRQMLEKIVAQWKIESMYGETDVQFYPDARLRGQPCEVIESTHPRPRRQFKFQKTRVYLDTQSRLPIRIEQHAFPDAPGKEPVLDELYEYVNLRTNVGLTDEDFDRRNPNYSF
ncbi:MAG: DUF1571 domain-containing protein [Planctomycetaceae bacterium]